MESNLTLRVNGRSLEIKYVDEKGNENFLEGKLDFDPFRTEDFHGRNAHLFARNVRTMKRVLTKMLNCDLDNLHVQIDTDPHSISSASDFLAGRFLLKFRQHIDKMDKDDYETKLFSHSFSQEKINSYLEDTKSNGIPFIDQYESKPIKKVYKFSSDSVKYA